MKTFTLLFFLILATHGSFAQEEVHGVVVSFEGMPLKRVKVITIDGAVKTKTNRKGEYKLSSNLPAHTLRFIKRGFVTIEVELGQRTQLDVTMYPPVKFRQKITVP